MRSRVCNRTTYADRSKHIDIKHRMITESIISGSVALSHVPSRDNLADIFTKPATPDMLKMFVAKYMGNIGEINSKL